jgi:hypothetical protein
MSGLTEEEAKTKWCPAVRMETDGEGVQNRRQGLSDSSGVGTQPWNKCVASRCMAWRWRRTYTDIALSNIPEGDRPVGIDPGDPVGFCGLAGRPA